jgi:hypothetical protein
MSFYLFRNCAERKYDKKFGTREELNKYLISRSQYATEIQHPHLPVYSRDISMSDGQLYDTQQLMNDGCCQMYVLFTEKELDLETMYFWNK